ncbi:MAG: FG-GAP-like repeat-containing protein [Acidobacteriota bacterium]
MITIRACSARRAAVVRTILFAALWLGLQAMPASAATVSATMTVVGHFNPTGQIVYTVVLSNPGPTVQPNNPGDEFVDALPPNVTFNNSSATSGTMGLLAGTVTWNGSVPANGSVTITINGQVGPLNTPGTVISNQGTVLFDADDNGSNESTASTDDPTVTGAANPTSFTVITAVTLTGRKTVSGTFSPGGLVTYTVVVTNAGPGFQNDQQGSEFFDILPTGLTDVNVTATSGTPALAPGSLGTVAFWDGNLASEESVTITISATIDSATPAGTVISNQGTVLYDADASGGNETEAPTDDPGLPGAADRTDFTVTSPATVGGFMTVTGIFTAGETVTYTVVLTNSGPFTQRNNPGNEFIDVLSDKLTLVSASASSGTAVADVGNRTVTWNGSLANGASVTITITATIVSAIAGGTEVSNQGAALFDETGNGTNSGTAMTDDPDVAGANNPTSFTVMSSAVIGSKAPWIDLDSDGFGDVVLYTPATGGGSSQVNDHNGGYTAFPEAWDAGWQIFPINLDLNDSTDLFFYRPASGVWVQGLSLGPGGGYSYTSGNWDPAWQVRPADLDGDGITDLFLYNPATGVWVKSFVDGFGDFANFTFGNWDAGWTFTKADLNGDGRDDFFLYKATDGVWVKAVSQEGVGSFDYPASGQWDTGWVIKAADLNGDGQTDLVLSNASGVHVSALSRVDGDFDYPVVGQWEPGWAIAAGDLNGDGWTDLFLYNAASGAWMEAYSDGFGDFNYYTGQWDTGWTVGVTDADGDGTADILLSNAAGVWVQATTAGPGAFTYTAGTWAPGSTVFTQKP